jgi:hypothetical protein
MSLERLRINHQVTNPLVGRSYVAADIDDARVDVSKATCLVDSPGKQHAVDQATVRVQVYLKAFSGQ